MTKEQWLEMWKLSGEEGEKAWQATQEMHARRGDATYVIPDIAGYKSMQTGEWIAGRRQHKEHLKRHGLIEIGNEIDAHMKPVKRDDRQDRETRKRMIADIMNGKGY
jgi:hypothetical protein